jgi:hypothetical protein
MLSVEMRRGVRSRESIIRFPVTACRIDPNIRSLILATEATWYWRGGKVLSYPSPSFGGLRLAGSYHAAW